MPLFRPVLALLVLLTNSLVAQPDSSSKRVLDEIAFGSCSHQDRPQPILRTIAASKPDLFLYVGDNIYASRKMFSAMPAVYEQLGNLREFRQLRASTTLLAVWDDHDFGINDGGADWTHRAEAQQHFLDFWGVPKDSPRRTREGVYSAHVFGPPGRCVQVILLDTRYHRSPLLREPEQPAGADGRRPRRAYIANDDPSATMLGPAQWQWLAEQLRQPANVRLIVTSIQFVAEDHPFEKWANMPRERQRLLDTLRTTGATGVILLSGDRHLGELSVLDDGEFDYPLYDLTASGLNMASKAFRPLEINRHRVATMNWGEHFGRVRIQWNQPVEKTQLALELVDLDGDVRLRHEIPLGLLRPND